MIIKDLPELVNEATVFKTYCYGYSKIVDTLKNIEKDFEHIVSVELIAGLNDTLDDEKCTLRFWNGDMLMFSYRDDGLKLITLHESPERYIVVIYDKDIYDFMVKQSSEDDKDYVVPELTKAKFEPIKDELRETYLSSIMHKYCTNYVRD